MNEFTASQAGQKQQKRVEIGWIVVNNPPVLPPSLQPGLCVISSKFGRNLRILLEGGYPGRIYLFGDCFDASPFMLVGRTTTALPIMPFIIGKLYAQIHPVCFIRVGL